MKKTKVLILTLCVMFNAIAMPSVLAGEKIAALDSPYYFQGHVEKIDQKKDDTKIFTGEVDTIEKKTEIKMTVAQVLSAGLSEEGDEFFAEITSAVEGEKGLMLPAGTLAHGKVIKLEDAKRMGRQGYIDLVFDYLITPDGREIPIEGSMTTKLNAAVSVAKIVAEDTLTTAVGGLIGGMTALQLLGIEAAIASHGYTLAGGAAIGGAVGLGMSVMRKGKEVLITPGDEIKVKVLAPVEMQVLSHDAFKQEELTNENLRVKINNVKLEKDPFGELNTITLQVSVNNYTDVDFSSYDIALINNYNKAYHPSIFNDNSIAFNRIKSGDRVAGHLSFSVDNPRNKHWLVFYDRRSRTMLARISVDNAEADIKREKKAKK